MPTTQAAPPLIQSFKDSNGNPLVGGLLYTYVAGTSTPQTTYTDATGATANANPIVLNSRGEAPVWLTIGQSYKFVLYDAFNALIYSVDQVASTNPIGTPITLSASGITGAAASGANADITSLTGPVSTVNGQTLQHTNDVINGNFVIAQIGTSFTSPANGAYDLDGWLNQNNTSAVITVTQVLASTPGRNGRQTVITTAKATAAAGEYVADVTLIEGYNIEKYVGNTFTLGFRTRVPVAGIHCVALRNSGTTDRSYIAEINFPTANVFQNCSVTVVGGLPTGGTWNYTNGVGLQVWFTHMVGTSLQTTPNAWNTGSFLGTVNQVNDCGAINNFWTLEKVTLNLGTVAAVSEITIDQELARCSRYATPVTLYARFPATTGSQAFSIGFSFPTMRAIPTVGAATGGTSLNLASFSPTINNTNNGRIEIISTAAGDCYSVDRTSLLTARL